MVLGRYAVGGETAFMVRRSEVHGHVLEALEVPALPGPALSVVNGIVVGMGAIATSIGNRPVFQAMRRLDMDQKAARAWSVEMKRRWCSKKPGYQQRARRITDGERRKWEALLKGEGLAEVTPIHTRGGAGLASREGRDLLKVDGRYRQRAATQAEIYAEANARMTDILGQLELETAVVRLRAQGLALRPIAIRLGLQKDQVAAILERIEGRF